MHILILMLSACNGPGVQTPTVELPSTSVAPHAPGNDAATPVESEELVTIGPSLPACTPQSAEGSLVSLVGVLLLPSGPVAGAVVFDRDRDSIECVGDCDDSAATRVCTEGIISPGLINGHDHMQYNSLPVWEPGRLFTDRYDWQGDSEYREFRSVWDQIKDDHSCAIMRWAELRGLMGGTTAAVGSYGNSCIAGLVRNLDEDLVAHGLGGYSLDYSSGRVSSYDEGDAADMRSDVERGAVDCVLNHVAEGVDDSVASEIDIMIDIGATFPGAAFVHATDASARQLAELAEDQVAILWSPRSNLHLYGDTTAAALARRLGVPVALGPDWTPSGSETPLAELRCADTYLTATGTPLSDIAIWKLTTSDAAYALGLDGMLGELKEGAKADFAVFPWSATPYRSLIDAPPADVWLTVVGGEALYGKSQLVDEVNGGTDGCETWTACGEERLVCAETDSASSYSHSVVEIQSELEQALAATSVDSSLAYAKELFPLQICENTRPPCDPTTPTDTDMDGDRIADSVDLCPTVYDPEQGDLDHDTVGDACDVCPLLPDATTCRHDPQDIDDDGVRREDDDCPVDWDPPQLDSDGDGLGDACDPCPTFDTSNGDPCPVSAEVIQDESNPEHPPSDTEVRVCNLVVTAVDAGAGFYAQDPSSATNAGLYVFDSGRNTVVEGDVVCVDGSYEDYFGLAELLPDSVTRTGSAAVPAPVVVSACDIGTTGALGEQYEAMLVTVQDVSVSDNNADDTATSAPWTDYGAFVVEGCLIIDDNVGAEHDPHPAVGTTYSSITGPLDWRYAERRIQPRRASDVAP